MSDRYLTTEDLHRIESDADIVTLLVNLAIALSPDSDLRMQLEDWRTDLHAPHSIPPVAPTIGLICVTLKQAVGFLTLIEDTDPNATIPEDSIGVYTERMVRVRELSSQCLRLLKERHFEILQPMPIEVAVELENLYLRAEALTVGPGEVRDGLFELTQKALIGR